MKPTRRLDAWHILQAASSAMRERAWQDGVRTADVRLVYDGEAIRLRITDEDQRKAATSALRQLGYLLARREDGRRPDEVTVTRWGFAPLAERAVHLDEAAEALTGGWRATAATAIDVYRSAAGDGRTEVDPKARSFAIGHTISGLTSRLLAGSGPHLSHDPTVRPDDPRTADLLATVWRLEQRVDELLTLHRGVAFDAITRYATYGSRMTRRQASRRAATAAAHRALGRLTAPAEYEPAERRAAEPPNRAVPATHARRRSGG